MADELDNPAWFALCGPHAHLGETIGAIRRYRPEVAMFVAVETPSDPRQLAGLSATIPPGGSVGLGTADVVELPATVKAAFRGRVAQMVSARRDLPLGDVPLVPLGAQHVPAMLDLIEVTHPGPFFAETYRMGAYFGIFVDGVLAAMAGERMRVNGFTEISAVCTRPEYRGRGFAKVLVAKVQRGIVARGETPFLHVAVENQTAISTYEKLGFARRRVINFTVVEAA